MRTPHDPRAAETGRRIRDIAREGPFSPAPFTDFFAPGLMAEGELELCCSARHEAIPEKGYVPAYTFEVRLGGTVIGEIGLRVGMTTGLYYSGHIGYSVHEAFRGRGVAPTACRLLLPLIRQHGFSKVLITNRPENAASRRVCEKIGARLLRIADLPEWHALYHEGNQQECIWVWHMG